MKHFLHYSLITLFILCFSFIFISNVSASTYPYDYNSSIRVYYWGDLSLNQTIQLTNGYSQSYLSFYNYEGQTLKNYNYFIVVACRHGADLTATVGTRSQGSSISQVQVYNSTELCNDGFDGQVSYLQYTVGKWEDMDGTWEETYADATASISGQYYIYVMNKYFSDTDQISQLIQGKLTYDLIQYQINQEYSNTNNIINNQNSNTQSIIDNQNSNTQQEIESQKACTIYDKTLATFENSYINSNGDLVTNSSITSTASDFIPVSSTTTTITSINAGTSSRYVCFYNSNKAKVSCINGSTITANYTFTIPDNASYFRYSSSNSNAPRFKICKNGNQALQDSLNDDNVGGAEKDASDFFSNFSTDTHGLTGIITAPLSAIESLTSATCSPLTLPLPFIDEDLELPCMRSIYEDFFGDFMDIYDVVVLGVLSYWIMVRIFAMVKDFKNPEHDEVEVMEL